MTTKQIVNGPSKFDLVVSFFQGYGANQKYVTFELDPPFEGHGGWTREVTKRLHCQIRSLKRGSSDEEWEFTGVFAHVGMTGGKDVGDVRGTYSTQTRKGVLEGQNL